MKKRTLLLALAVVLVLSCALPSHAEEQKTIRISWWGNQIRADITMAVLDMYSELHPDVKFEAEFSDWGSYWDKLATQAAAGSMPDIIQHDYAYLASYIDKGLLADLTPYMESGVLDMSDVSENILAAGLVNDKLYAVVLGVNVPMFIYDPEIVAQAGVTIPEDLTWDAFKEICKTIYEKTGVQTNYEANEIQLQIMARTKGYTLFDPDEPKLGMPDATVATEFFKLYEDGIRDGYLISQEYYVEHARGVVEERPIITGQTWNDFGTSNNSAMVAAAGRELIMHLRPQDADAVREGTYIKPGTFFTVAATTQYSEECADFLSFFTNSIEANEILAGERGVPIASKVATAMGEDLEGFEKHMFEFVEYAKDHSSPIDPPNPAGAIEVVSLIEDLVERVCYGRLTAEAAGEEFYIRANEILAKAAQ